MTDERPDVKHIWTMPDGWWRAEALWRPNKTCKQQESYFVACLTASTETKNSSYFDDFLKQVVYCSFMNSSLAPLDPTVVRSHVCLRSLRPATCYYVMSSLAISSPFLLCKDFFYFQFQAGMPTLLLSCCIWILIGCPILICSSNS
ncbi:hypothetical protein BDA96_01G461800 [Sorghum bicolor]|uniref:Uncharacterized protein n=1 Tax=Sorghum bicolor TaxID=4558 RepID=A0A921S5M1_SORBI|nr:hypothetical protein BDA96_01G461800 [Sorghum bicolor]